MTIFWANAGSHLCGEQEHLEDKAMPAQHPPGADGGNIAV
jgi:hypothetical protein